MQSGYDVMVIYFFLVLLCVSVGGVLAQPNDMCGMVSELSEGTQG